jgi:hypothetical protein
VVIYLLIPVSWHDITKKQGFNYPVSLRGCAPWFSTLPPELLISLTLGNYARVIYVFIDSKNTKFSA